MIRNLLDRLFMQKKTVDEVMTSSGFAHGQEKDITEAEQRRLYMKNILDVAEKILTEETGENEETHPIYQLIKVLTDIELLGYIYKTISTHDIDNSDRFFIDAMLPDNTFCNEHLFLNDKGEEVTINHILYAKDNSCDRKECIRLGGDPLLASPWCAMKLTNVISGKSFKEKFKQDPQHHCLQLFLPCGVSFTVDYGHHSITKGILMNEESCETNKVYEITDIHRNLYTDGVNFFRKSDNCIFGSVNNFNLSVVFEIGSLIAKYMTTKNIRFHGKLLRDYC